MHQTLSSHTIKSWPVLFEGEMLFGLMVHGVLGKKPAYEGKRFGSAYMFSGCVSSIHKTWAKSGQTWMSDKCQTRLWSAWAEWRWPRETGQERNSSTCTKQEDTWPWRNVSQTNWAEPVQWIVPMQWLSLAGLMSRTQYLNSNGVLCRILPTTTTCT